LADLGSATWIDFLKPSSTPELVDQTFAFLKADGSVYSVNFNLSERQQYGCSGYWSYSDREV